QDERDKVREAELAEREKQAQLKKQQESAKLKAENQQRISSLLAKKEVKLATSDEAAQINWQNAAQDLTKKEASLQAIVVPNQDDLQQELNNAKEERIKKQAELEKQVKMPLPEEVPVEPSVPTEVSPLAHPPEQLSDAALEKEELPFVIPPEQ